MFSLVVADSYEELVPEFVERLQRPRRLASLRDHVIAREWVVAPSLGTRQWLVATMASHLGVSAGRRDGIVANWHNDFPSMVTQRVLNAHLTATTGRDVDPWSLTQLPFVIYDWAVKNPTAPGASLVASGPHSVSLARCRQAADLFDRYFTWRADMVLDWLTNEPTAYDADEAVQVALFRAIRDYLNLASPVERWDDAWAQVTTYLDVLPARDRISIFGLSSLPGGTRYVAALTALSEVMDVTVYLARPFDETCIPPSGHRSDFTSEILQMWGGSSLALASMLNELRTISSEPVAPRLPTTAPTSVLQAIQHVLRTDEILTAAPDASLIIHETHGEIRQAEILRDAIRHELNEDRDISLRESDIVVVCPDITTFEPLIRTAFGPRRLEAMSDVEPALAYNIADRSLSHDGLYLQGVRHFLSLVRSRCTRSEILGFLAEPTVKFARELTGDDDELFSSWTLDADIRWGMNEAHRQHLKVTGLGLVNTWEAGIRRLRLGAFVENPRLRSVSGLLPVEIAPAHFDRLVALTKIVTELIDAISDTWTSKTLSDWMKWYDTWVHRFVVPRSEDAREHERVLGAINSVREANDANTEPLTVADFLAVLDEAFDSIGSVASVMTGGVTITSPETVRGLSYRSLYILGFDGDAFTAPEWEWADLRRRESRAGDITPPDDARGRLRELMISATERLTIIRNGYDVTSNKHVGPGTAYSEFLDLVQSITGGTAVTVAHPRNSFSPENFTSDAVFSQSLRELGVVRGPWSFSTFDQQLVESEDPLSWAKHYDAGAVTNVDTSTVTLGQLEATMKNPPKVFVQRSFGISLPDDELARVDDIDAEVAGLLQHEIVETLWLEEQAETDLRTVIDLEKALAAMISSGVVPPAPILDSPRFIKIAAAMATFYRNAVANRNRRHLSISLPLAASTITGTVDIFEGETDTVLVEVLTSKLKVRSIAGVWLRALAVRATIGGPMSLHLVFRKEDPNDDVPVAEKIFSMPESDISAARDVLGDMVDFYQANLASPIPFAIGDEQKNFDDPCLSSAKWMATTFGMNFDAPYLGDPYWSVALGHLTRDEVFYDSTVWGYKEIFPWMKIRLNSVVSLFQFVEEVAPDGK